MTRSVPRAPTRDGGVIAEPPLAAAGALLKRNRAQFAQSSLELLGRSLSELRGLARREAVGAAHRYLGDRAEPIPAVDDRSVVLAGHQPELFHPGVWVKNFALTGLAQRYGAAPLNLIVDNDTVKATGLRLPIPGDPPRLQTLPFDRWAGETPYEEHRLAEADQFASFGARALAALRGWGYEPLLASFWDTVCRAARADWSLVERFPAARRDLERTWGCHNLELPVSMLCGTEAFGVFAAHLLRDLPRFHALYNATVRDYRRRHRLKSGSHPVPDLAADGDWLEAPFWGWRAGGARRGRLFARATPLAVELRAGDDPWPDLPPRPGELEAAGCKLRPRALTTTLFARVFLGDLFLHGIGGGKYDELTDGLIRGFYGLEPPAYLMLSATRHLPLPAHAATPAERARLARELRDTWYNPQRHLPPWIDCASAELVRQKEAWIARTPLDRAGRRERFAEIRRATARLRPALGTRRPELEQALAAVEAQLSANAILQRRDYAFCLFPEATLRPFCTAFLRCAEAVP